MKDEEKYELGPCPFCGKDTLEYTRPVTHYEKDDRYGLNLTPKDGVELIARDTHHMSSQLRFLGTACTADDCGIGMITGRGQFEPSHPDNVRYPADEV